MSTSSSPSQRKLHEMSGKMGFSRNSSDANTLPIHSKKRQSPGTDLDPTSSMLEEAERRPLRKPFSFLSSRLKNLPALDDELFSDAKTSQSQPKWPSSFDVPKVNGALDHPALPPHLLSDMERRMFYQGGKQRLSVMKRKKTEARIIKHVQGLASRLQHVKLIT